MFDIILSIVSPVIVKDHIFNLTSLAVLAERSIVDNLPMFIFTSLFKTNKSGHQTQIGTCIIIGKYEYSVKNSKYCMVLFNYLK